MTRGFFDSNVLLYAFNNADARGPKALELLHRGGAISVQCLNEFASVALRKLQFGWADTHEALARVRSLCDPIVTLDAELHDLGLAVAQQYKLSIYDGMIVAAALTAHCETLYSEDMHAGLVIEGRVTITNPFA